MATAQPGRGETISIVRFVTSILRHWRLTLGIPLAGALLVVAVSFLFPRIYAADVAFEPEHQKSSPLAGISGLAAQLGIPTGLTSATPPAFYAEVLQSRPILEQLLVTRFPDPRRAGASDSVALIDLLGVRGATLPQRLERGLRRLRKALTVRTDLKTDIVRVTAESRYPAVAAAMANELVRLLDVFNGSTRRSQARQTRLFLQARLAAADDSLRAAEDRLRYLYENNRSWQTSPALVFEESRLRRRVASAEEMYATLQRNFETARIDEVNDTPVLTVIEPATVPQRKVRPQRLLLAVLTFAGLWLVGAAAASVKDAVRTRPREDVLELADLLRGWRVPFISRVPRV